MSFLKDIRSEWKENSKANQPIPDPETHVNPPSLGQAMRQSPKSHISAIIDAASLYWKTLVDSKEALREAQEDDEFLRQAKALRARQILEAKGIDIKEDEDNLKGSDMDTIAERVKAMYPKEMPQDLSGAIDALKDKKDDIRDLAEDRLEVMAGAMGEFMHGYREGKEQSVKEVEEATDAEVKQFVSGIVGSIGEKKEEGKNEENK